ncbi:SDR family NAD(P)-dependent oxidoreductase [Robertmurraya yapensis]|uniref:SDR family NAD(P)-dependent oxidoreductase n=1 Tax=Bacillus yapensis TaxID=2492960 RepID=A0A431VRU3_9BACI|nr:oxidoreductase [Bacillus yapensis]RTR25952.1 SDR family NAD(P)-dependent oxidoreductase [Bacillus yapensis]TKS93531.1 SDR family NAD(P)-dependent oxidoreductase [Bacillus yapensis]
MRNQESNNRVVLITGASAGMGEAAAKLFSEKGYVVYAGARRVDKMVHLQKLGVKTRYLDVTSTESNQTLVNEILQKEKRIDILINSAGYGSFGALEDVSPEEAKRQFDVNVFGAANLTQLILPTMRAQRSGKIVNISSIGGQIYTPLGGWYYASKHALEAMSDTLRLEMKSFGVDVIIIEPGGTATEWQKVTNEHMLAATSMDSPYRALVEQFASMEETGFATSEDIAALIYKSVTDPNPKTRYQLRFAEKLIVILARKLPYKMFDRIMLSQMKRLSKNISE